MKACISFLLCALALTVSAQTVDGPQAVAAKPVTLPLRDGGEITVEANYKERPLLKAEAPETLPPKRMAIFVSDNTRQNFARACDAIRNQVAAQVSGDGVEIIDYEEAVAAVRPLMEPVKAADGAAATGFGERLYASIGQMFGLATAQTADGRNTTQDEKLLANISRTRLAETMGADYVLMVTLDRFSKSTRTLKDRRLGGTIVNELYKISASYKALDAYAGSAIGGGTLTAQTTVRQSPGVEISFDDYADGLEEQIASEMARAIAEKAPGWREASLKASGIKVGFNATAYNPAEQPIYLPKTKDGAFVTTDRTPAPLAVTVEVDGIARGTTDSVIPLSPGLHKVRFTRPGWDDVTMTVTPREGMVLTVGMRMTEAEYARLKDSIEFLHRLTSEREINQATVKVLEGKAKMLEQSGFRVDAKELPDVHLHTLF